MELSSLRSENFELFSPKDINNMNFDKKINRINTHSSKWDMMEEIYGVAPKTGTPMWVADMDFKAAAPILNAVEQVAQHGILGYTKPTATLFDAIINWHGSRYNLQLDKEN